MSNPIAPITPTPVSAPVTVARAAVTPEQVAALITVIGSANPPVLALPEGKTLADVRSFILNIGPTGAGNLDIRIA